MTVRGNAILEKASLQGRLDDFDFSMFIQEVMISESGYVLDVGNWENVNAELVIQLNEKIKKASNSLETIYDCVKGKKWGNKYENYKKYVRKLCFRDKQCI